MPSSPNVTAKASSCRLWTSVKLGNGGKRAKQVPRVTILCLAAHALLDSADCFSKWMSACILSSTTSSSKHARTSSKGLCPIGHTWAFPIYNETTPLSKEPDWKHTRSQDWILIALSRCKTNTASSCKHANKQVTSPPYQLQKDFCQHVYCIPMVHNKC